MQNLSLPISPSPAAKTASKPSDNGVDKVDPAQANDTFRNLLSRQVQDKQVAERQAQAQAQVKQAAQAASGGRPAPAHAADKAPAKAQDTRLDKDGKPVVDDAKDGKDVSVVDAAQLAADAAAAAAAAKQDAAAGDATTAAVVADPSALNIPVPVAAPMPVPLLAQGNSASAEQLAAEPGAKPQTLDQVLSNALSKDKAAAGDKAALDEAGADKRGNWLERMLPQGGKQAATDDGALTKLAASLAKDAPVKDAPAPLTLQGSLPLSNAQQAQQAAAVPGASNNILPSPGKSGWDQAISQKVMYMVGSGEQSASLTLNPPDLGPLQVVIHVHNDQADTTFISDNPEVRQALENGMATLRDKLGDAGIQLGQANVNANSQSQQEFQQAAHSRMARHAADSGNSSAQDSVASVAQAAVRVANGLVDTFA